MPNRDKRGGRRTPAQPAPVSGPGALSQRTDGPVSKNPSNAEQATQSPQRIPGQTYGVGKQLMDQQQSAPLAAAPNTGGIPSPSNSGNGGQGVSLPFDPFGPAENEEMVVDDDDIYIDNPDMFIEELARIESHPDLINLLSQRAIRGM